MKTIIQYECEICGKRYYDEESAKDCEEKGVFDNSPYPPGLIFPYYHHEFVGIFAIPKTIEWYGENKHFGRSSFWACRANHNDSLGDEACGGDFFYSKPGAFERWLEINHIEKSLIERKEFKRMVAYLKSVNIQPSYYDQNGKLHLV